MELVGGGIDGKELEERGVLMLVLGVVYLMLHNVRVCVCASGSFSLGDRNVCERQRLPMATVFIVKLFGI